MPDSRTLVRKRDARYANRASCVFSAPLITSIFVDFDPRSIAKTAVGLLYKGESCNDVGNAPRAGAVKKNGEREEKKERKALESRAKEVNASGGTREGGKPREHMAETRDTGRSPRE